MFCRETLAGDWLEVIGLWQPGDERTGEHNRPYTPHPDFWIAALWKKLMGVRVLGANTTNITAAVTVGRDTADTQEQDSWVVVPGYSCNFGLPYNGTDAVPFYGKTNSSAACQAECAAASKANPTVSPPRHFKRLTMNSLTAHNNPATPNSLRHATGCTVDGSSGHVNRTVGARRDAEGFGPTPATAGLMTSGRCRPSAQR